MADRNVRLTFRLHPLGGIVVFGSDPEDASGGILNGKASAREYIVSDLFEFGFRGEAEEIRVTLSPRPGTTKDVVFDVPKSEHLMVRLGFREGPGEQIR